MAAFGDLISVQLVSMYNPTYMKNALGYTIENTGWLAALPVVAQFAVKITSGVSSDKLRFVAK
jgi:hypothetical protein